MLVIQEVSPYNDDELFHKYKIDSEVNMSHRVQMTNPVNQLHEFKFSQKPFVMLFQTESCGVCPAIEPRLKDLLEDYGLSYIAIDAGKYPEIAGQHQVFTVPTILVWSENREILRESRFINFSKIERLFEFIQICDVDDDKLSHSNN